MIKLHVAPPSPRAFKVLAVARHLGLDFELCPVDLVNGDQLRPEFTRLNPNQKMRVLEDDGFVIWESNAIAQYLAAKKPGRRPAAIGSPHSSRRDAMAVLGQRTLGPAPPWSSSTW
jgi:glutathione S-transferase